MKRLLWAAVTILATAGCSTTPEEKAKKIYADGLKKIARYDYAEADSSFTKLSADQPSSLYGPLGRAQALERQMQFYDALEIYMMVRQTQSGFLPVYLPMARLYTKISDHEQAWRLLNDYQSMRGDSIESEALFALTNAALSTGRNSQATRYLGALNQRKEDLPTVDFLKAQLTFLLNRIEISDSLAQAGFANPQKDPRYYYYAANYLETRDLHDSSMIFSRKSVETSSDDFEMYYAHFMRALRVGYLFEARKTLEKIRELDEIGMAAHGLSMYYYWAAGDAYRANHHNTEYQKLAPASYTGYFYDIESRWMVSDIISCRGNVEYLNTMMLRRNAAQQFLDYFRGRLVLTYSKVFEPETDVQSIRNSPGWRTDQLEYKMQELYFFGISGQRELFDETITIYNQYRGADAEWLAAIGNIFASPKIGFYDSAIVYYQRSLKLAPSNRSAFSGLILATSAVKGADSALELFASFPHFEQRFATFAISKASLLAIKKRSEDALALFQSASAAVKDNPRWYVRMAEEFDRQGDFARAEKIFDHLVSQSSENPDALAAAARYNVDRGNYAQALTLAQAGLKLEPGNPSLEILHARAQHAVGNKQEAIQTLERILEKVDGDVDANIYLSQMLAADSTDFIRAENLARNATFNANSSVRSLLNLMEIYRLNNNTTAVRGEATRFIQSKPVHPAGYYYLGLVSSKEGKPDQAREYLEYSLKLGLVGPQSDSARVILQQMQG